MRWIALLAPLLIAATVTAHADGGQPGARHARGPIDANSDGIVTREEAKAHPRLSADFDAADSNKDGQLDAAELNAHRERMKGEMRAEAEERWKVADIDGDGSLSLAEAQASMPRLAEHYDQVDADRNGLVSRDEMRSARMKSKRRP